LGYGQRETEDWVKRLGPEDYARFDHRRTTLAAIITSEGADSTLQAL
jgi:hypothetical protein